MSALLCSCGDYLIPLYPLIAVPQPSKPGEPKPMYLSEEIAALCVQAACETDPHKLLELTTRINELFEEQDQIQQLADLNSGLDA
jgi:hypothetical protein